MTITADEMREMAADLDSIDCGYSAILDDAAAMLRSIAEEREAPPSPTRLPDCFSISGKVKDGEHKGETVWLYWSPEAVDGGNGQVQKVGPTDFHPKMINGSRMRGHAPRVKRG